MELNATERRTLLAALDFYRLKKAAESKLESQKALKRDRVQAQQIEATYARLLAIVDDLKVRIACR